MSTTLDKSVAVHYASAKDDGTPATVIQAKMSTHFRGAVLDWLSQYPDEVEVLWCRRPSFPSHHHRPPPPRTPSALSHRSRHVRRPE